MCFINTFIIVVTNFLAIYYLKRSCILQLLFKFYFTTLSYLHPPFDVPVPSAFATVPKV